MNKIAPLVRVTDLHKTYKTPEGPVNAVDGVTFSIQPGEAVGLVGESGSGKTTLAELLVRIQEPTQGTIILNGRDVTHISGRKFRPLRKQIQLVSQNPTMLLNQRANVGKILSDQLGDHNIVPKDQRPGRVLELLDQVNLDADLIKSLPERLSGGQRQRVGIARALATKPEFVILDEPTSSLDVPNRMQIIALLQDLQADLGLAYLFISHDLSIVRHICNRVLVMQDGKIVEDGNNQRIFVFPQQAHTQELVGAAPIPSLGIRRTSPRRLSEPNNP